MKFINQHSTNIAKILISPFETIKEK